MTQHVAYVPGESSSAVTAAQAAALSTSGVSWGAILAGAVAAAALSFILVILGFGLGLSSVSPWSGEGLSAKTITFATAGWLVFTQLASAGIGGYLAGRLRVKWAGVHTHEVYFRDTAHGFLAWSVASLLTAALLGSAVGSVISGGAKLAGSGAAAVAATGAAGAAVAGNTSGSGNQAGMGDAASGYFIDMLFRPQSAASAPANAPAAAGTAAPVPGAESAPLALAPAAGGPAPRAADEPRDAGIAPAQRLEVTRIFANALHQGALPDADRAYMGQLVARRTGLSQADAEKRVADIFANSKKALDDAATKAKEAADAARKATAYGSLWMFFSLLLGAFVASLSATYGGRRRDLPSFAAPVTVTREPVIDN